MVLNVKCDRHVCDEFDHVFWTGPIDEFFGWRKGVLEYRTLDFEQITVDEHDYQGAPVIVYPDSFPDWTRITEHKHFSPWNPTIKKSVIYKERSRAWTQQDLPFYPVRLARDKESLTQYQWLAEQEKNVTFLGRLGTYRYIDMDQSVKEAICVAHNFIRRTSTSPYVSRPATATELLLSQLSGPHGRVVTP